MLKKVKSEDSGLGPGSAQTAKRTGRNAPEASPKPGPKAVRQSDASDSLSDPRGKHAAVLRAIAEHPCTKRDLVAGGVASKSTVYKIVSALERAGLVSPGDDGLYTVTPKGEEVLRGLASLKEQLPSQGGKAEREPDEESMAARQLISRQRIEREEIKLEADKVKLEALKAKTSDDLDEQMKQERVRALRIRNNRAEQRERKEEMKLRAAAQREAERDPQSEVVVRVVIRRRDPLDGVELKVWTELDAKELGGEPTSESIESQVLEYIEREGEDRFEYLYKLFNACGKLLHHGWRDSLESERDRESRKLDRDIAEAERRLAEVRASRPKRAGPRFRKVRFVPPPWGLPWKR